MLLTRGCSWVGGTHPLLLGEGDKHRNGDERRSEEIGDQGGGGYGIRVRLSVNSLQLVFGDLCLQVQ